jgi:hypothetical protein
MAAEIEKRLWQAVKFELAPEIRKDFKWALFDKKNKFLHGTSRSLILQNKQVILM